MTWLGFFYYGLQYWKQGKSPEAGTFGDFFGAINSLFSAFALFGVVYSIRQQQEALKHQKEELKLTRNEAFLSRNEFEKSNVIYTLQTSIMAANAELELAAKHLDHLSKIYQHTNEGRKTLPLHLDIAKYTLETVKRTSTPLGTADDFSYNNLRDLMDKQSKLEPLGGDKEKKAIAKIVNEGTLEEAILTLETYHDARQTIKGLSSELKKLDTTAGVDFKK